MRTILQLNEKRELNDFVILCIIQNKNTNFKWLFLVQLDFCLIKAYTVESV